MKNLKNPLNLSILRNVLYIGKRFFRLFKYSLHWEKVGKIAIAHTFLIIFLCTYVLCNMLLNYHCVSDVLDEDSFLVMRVNESQSMSLCDVDDSCFELYFHWWIMLNLSQCSFRKCGHNTEPTCMFLQPNYAIENSFQNERYWLVLKSSSTSKWS